MSIPLGKLVNVNPLTPEFLDNRDAEVSFLPLAAVWPYGRADVSGRAIAAKVAGGYTQFRNGDVLVPKITPTFEAARAIVADLETPLGAGTTELHVLRALPGVDARFIAYVTRSLPFLQEGATTLQGVGNLRRVPSDWLTKFPVLVTDLEEQYAIADYLDRETKRIDELIAEQRGLIETLRERRVELIAQGVTRGIDGDSLGTSPMPWIGFIPQGWTSGRIKHLGEVTLGKMLQSRGKEGDVEAPYMRAANVQPDGVVADSDFKTMWFTLAELRSLDLQMGDVVVVEGGVGGYGRAAFLRESLVGWGFQNSINRIRPFGDGRFISYYLQAVRAKGFIGAYSNIVSMPHLTAEKLNALPVPIPPDSEQRRISDYLDDQTSRIDDLITESEDLIALSQERRAALITAAVTGQIDVRAAA